MAQIDASVISTVNGTRIKPNIDFIKRNKRVEMFSSLLKKASTCPNFDINATTNDVNEGHTLVHHAAWNGNFDLVQYLITEQGLSPTAVDKDYKCSLSLTDNKGWNAIHFSSFKGHTHFIKHITSQYPQYISLLHSTNNEGNIPLHLACESGNIQLVTFLINDMKCDVNAKDTHDQTCVMYACFSGNLDLVQLLIQQYKLEPININNTGFSVLHAAAQTGHTHILEWYSQEYSVDITNYTDNNKYTLAHYAAYKGKLHCLQELINKYQCDVNATNTDDGSIVLHKACERGHVPVVLYLTSLPQLENHQLDLCAVNDKGMAPIHLACGNGRLNLIQYIIEHIPSSLELPHSKHGHTPFLAAVYFNQLEVIKYLISKKCNLSATDVIGSGAVHISVWRGHLNVLKYLIVDNNYCNPNATDHKGCTPLHVAVADNKYEILEYLLSKSIPSMSVVWLPCQRERQNMVSLLLKASLSNNNLLITNKKGQTPLHLAAASGHKDTAEALLFSVTGSSTHHDLLTATDDEGSTVLHTACSNGHIDVFRYLS
ncbi:PREDICTED: serine/threonine-protein phosphatase 6 regulatory ankyrin repeat subunit A-like, partial [Amphimedon queenslandica]|uniref:Uncharacterized protein n=1 Tax=Amphimedon queenslandica TaxID=400682 RepID=A0AAN0JXZ9_AMPQE